MDRDAITSLPAAEAARAIAAGELFLAQLAELERRLGREVLLRDLSPQRSG